MVQKVPLTCPALELAAVVFNPVRGVFFSPGRSRTGKPWVTCGKRPQAPQGASYSATSSRKTWGSRRLLRGLLSPRPFVTQGSGVALHPGLKKTPLAGLILDRGLRNPVKVMFIVASGASDREDDSERPWVLSEQTP